ncbi:hypothetical protein FACS1894186_1010 [Alphaproteobacteria bacterium]|nr:hypothetical protein FACS1894186_1010 [Alphaproteobacteria bacterium]
MLNGLKNAVSKHWLNGQKLPDGVSVSKGVMHIDTSAHGASSREINLDGANLDGVKSIIIDGKRPARISMRGVHAPQARLSVEDVGQIYLNASDSSFSDVHIGSGGFEPGAAAPSSSINLDDVSAGTISLETRRYSAISARHLEADSFKVIARGDERLINEMDIRGAHVKECYLDAEFGALRDDGVKTDKFEIRASDGKIVRKDSPEKPISDKDDQTQKAEDAKEPGKDGEKPKIVDVAQLMRLKEMANARQRVREPLPRL